MTRIQPVMIVDAFTDTAFRGNPAAVCVVPFFPEDRILQDIAREMNLSETAFVTPRQDGGYDLRWFTPTCEVDLCGHATLAATHALLERGDILPGQPIRFHTKSGELKAEIRDGLITLDFPAQPGQAFDKAKLADCLGVPVLNAEFNGVKILAEVTDYEALLNCQPDSTAIAALNVQGLIVTTATGCNGFDFASRFFAPSVGIQEDPVCGSAHCMLAPYWATRLSKTEFTALQASPRTGELWVTLAGDRVRLAGHAVITLRGTLEYDEEKVHAADHAA